MESALLSYSAGLGSVSMTLGLGIPSGPGLGALLAALALVLGVAVISAQLNIYNGVLSSPTLSLVFGLSVGVEVRTKPLEHVSRKRLGGLGPGDIHVTPLGTQSS